MDNELRVPYNNTNSAPFYSSKFSKNPFIKPAEAAEKFWSTDKFEWWFQIGLKYERRSSPDDQGGLVSFKTAITSTWTEGVCGF